MLSIVIPVYGGASLTRDCLASLEGRLGARESEIIIVDDASPDEETRSFLSSLTGSGQIRVLFQKENQGFAAACNRGYREAKGEFVLFLNNDTEVLDGWLEPLLQAFDDPKVAIAGSLLLYPGKRLIQHAGVGFTKQGGRLRVFHLGQYWRLSEVEEAGRTLDLPAVTGACMALRKDAIGVQMPFDQGFRNGYEDLDLCMRMWAAGWKVRYCGGSRVVHHESVSAGRFSSETENAQRFDRLWKDAPGQLDPARGKWELRDRRFRREFILQPTPRLAGKIADLANAVGRHEEASLWKEFARGRFLPFRRIDRVRQDWLRRELGLSELKVRRA